MIDLWNISKFIHIKPSRRSLADHLTFLSSSDYRRLRNGETVVTLRAMIHCRVSSHHSHWVDRWSVIRLSLSAGWRTVLRHHLHAIPNSDFLPLHRANPIDVLLSGDVFKTNGPKKQLSPLTIPRSQPPLAYALSSYKHICCTTRSLNRFLYSEWTQRSCIRWHYIDIIYSSTVNQFINFASLSVFYNNILVVTTRAKIVLSKSLDQL